MEKKEPVKRVLEEGSQEERTRRVIRKIGEERIANIKVIENPPALEGEELDMENFEVMDWDAEMKKHLDNIKKEEEKRNKLLEEKEKQEKSWELAKLCRKFLEENSKEWQRKKKARDSEKEKRTRLEKVKWKRREEKVIEMKDNLAREMEMIPKDTRDRMMEEEMREKRLEMTRTKKELWSLKSREKKFKRKSPLVKILEEMREVEEKREKVREILEKMTKGVDKLGLSCAKLSSCWILRLD